MLSWFSKRPLVLVICTANICRSPVAAALLRSELKQRGAKKVCRVVSAGTSVAAPGRRPDPRMRRLAKTIGVSLRGEHARPLTPELIANAHLIVAMEPKHLDAVASLSHGREVSPRDATNVPERPARLELLGAWSPSLAGAPIPDPYYSNQAAIEQVFAQLRESAQGLAAALASGELELR